MKEAEEPSQGNGMLKTFLNAVLEGKQHEIKKRVYLLEEYQ